MIGVSLQSIGGGVGRCGHEFGNKSNSFKCFSRECVRRSSNDKCSYGQFESNKTFEAFFGKRVVLKVFAE